MVEPQSVEYTTFAGKLAQAYGEGRRREGVVGRRWGIGWEF
jgi:hypothetical protein